MELRLSKLRPSVALLEFNKQPKCETLLDKFEQPQRETAHVFFHTKQNSVPEFCPLIILSIYGVGVKSILQGPGSSMGSEHLVLPGDDSRNASIS